MPFLDKILGTIGLARKSVSDNLALASGVGQDPFALWLGSRKVNPKRALQEFKGWSYACIRAIAEELANMEFVLKRIGAKGVEEVAEHELLDLLEAVNHFQTGYELKYLTGAYLESVGNAYWLLDGVENIGDKPSAIFILNPANIKPIRADLPEFITGYKYTIDNTEETFEPHQILHIKYPDIENPYEGIGTIQKIAEWIETDNNATAFNLKFFEHGARLSGILESESAKTKEQINIIKKSFEQIYAAKDNAYKVAMLPQGTKFKEASASPKDMDFANMQTMMRDKILAGFRVPRTVLGITDDVNRANAEATDVVFAKRTIKPKMKLIVSYLNEFLVPRYGDDLILDFKDPVPEDRALEIKEMQAALAGQPVMSVNEAREQYFGKGPVSGRGDTVMTDFNKVPLGKPKKSGSKTVKLPLRIRGRRLTQHAQNAKKRQDIADSIGKKLAKELKDFEKDYKKVLKKNIGELTDEEFEVLWKQLVNRLEPYQLLMTEAIVEFNKGWVKQAIDNLSRAIKSIPTKGIDEGALFDFEEQTQKLEDSTLSISFDLFEAEAIAAAELLGATVEPLSPETREAIKRSVNLMANKYNETTLKTLKEKLEQALADGQGINELKQEIRRIGEFSDEVRAEMVAHNETFRTANSAKREAWKQSGVVEGVRWFTAADEKVCPFCAPLHNQIVGINDKFFNLGETVTGVDENGKRVSMRLDYDDVQDPPLHSRCRCTTRPVIISD